MYVSPSAKPAVYICRCSCLRVSKYSQNSEQFRYFIYEGYEEQRIFRYFIYEGYEEQRILFRYFIDEGYEDGKYVNIEHFSVI